MRNEGERESLSRRDVKLVVRESSASRTIADLILDEGSLKPAIKASLNGSLISSDGQGPMNCANTPDQYFLIYWLRRIAADCRMERSSRWLSAILHNPRPPSAMSC